MNSDIAKGILIGAVISTVGWVGGAYLLLHFVGYMLNSH